jgi:hypothetical protein
VAAPTTLQGNRVVRAALKRVSPDPAPPPISPIDWSIKPSVERGCGGILQVAGRSLLSPVRQNALPPPLGAPGKPVRLSEIDVAAVLDLRSDALCEPGLDAQATAAMPSVPTGGRSVGAPARLPF